MSDSQSKSPSIPSWQRKQPSIQNEGSANNSDQSQSPPESSSRVALVEKAAKFLEDEDIRQASRESKISFLQGKGLTTEEIVKLLGEPPDESSEKDAPDRVAATTTELKSNESDQDGSQSLQSSGEPSRSTSSDIPPIITYPEFLLHSQKPPPLITAQRLLTTAYIVSGTAALTYGASKYVVEPMVESLTSARHSLFETAIEGLGMLNEKLEDVVSILPDDYKLTPDSGLEPDELEASAFFNRSAGTQTSPHLSRSNSSSSESQPKEVSAIESQTTRLKKLEEDMRGLLDPSQTEPYAPTPSQQMKEKMNNFQKYLDGLMYGSVEAVPGFSGGKSKEDSIAVVKGEIRQAKGVLLSSRNFPSSVGINGWRTS